MDPGHQLRKLAPRPAWGSPEHLKILKEKEGGIPMKWEHFTAVVVRTTSEKIGGQKDLTVFMEEYPVKYWRTRTMHHLAGLASGVPEFWAGFSEVSKNFGSIIHLKKIELVATDLVYSVLIELFESGIVSKVG
jgi:hypothetical protein